jgi:hypothetical protein
MAVQQDYRTRDLYFAAYLNASGVEMVDTQRRGSEVQFIFEYVDDMRERRNGYFSGQADVSALDYANAIKSLKSLIHEV